MFLEQGGDILSSLDGVNVKSIFGQDRQLKSHARGEKEFCFMSMYIGQNTSQIFPWIQKKYKLLMIYGPRS